MAKITIPAFSVELPELFGLYDMPWDEARKKLRDDFSEKVAGPFNETFKQFRTRRDTDEFRQCFWMAACQDSTDKIAHGWLYSIDDEWDVREPDYTFSFSVHGGARADTRIPDWEPCVSGNWVQIFSFIVDWIKKEITYLYPQRMASRQRYDSGLINVEQCCRYIEEIEAALKASH